MCRLWDNVEKCGIVGQATDDNTALVFCMLDNLGCTHSLSLSVFLPLSPLKSM